MAYALILVSALNNTGFIAGRYPSYVTCQRAITKKFPHRAAICVRFSFTKAAQ